MFFKLDRNLFALISALTVVACRGEDAGATDTDTTNPSTGGESVSSTMTPTTTLDASTSTSTSDGTTSGTTAAPTTDPCADSGGFIGCNTSTGGGAPQPNGSTCESDADCESMNCYKNDILMLAICADCNEDADCVAAGTGTACSLDLGTQSIACTDGPNGSTCMSGHCDAVINVPIPGIIPDTCGECSSSADCTMPDICSPNFDTMAFSGQKSCVAPGSVENDQLCPDGAEGAMACMSGHCTTATIMGIVPVNICGECEADGDCAMGQTCMPAEASMNGFSGSVCG